MIALGRVVFRYRGVIFPAILIVLLLVAQPVHPLGDDKYDAWFDAAGLLVVLLGLAVRAVTIGYEYIVRGGRGKQVYADGLVQGGVYAHTRNPMYLGNALIMVGMAIVFNAPAFYLIALPLTAFLYVLIIAAEEDYLERKFGAAFDDYRQRVNRILPRLSGFRRSIAGMRFNWRRVLVKDYNTVFLAIAAVALLDWWHDYGVHGSLTLQTPDHAAMAVGLVAWLVVFLIVWRLKKTRRLEAETLEPGRDP
jgi:protein-S-isoprenylcysteine O-methyltransferase Ste14